MSKIDSKPDYLYCLNNGSCIHRRGCRRWVGNFSFEDENKIKAMSSLKVNESGCISNFSDVNSDNSFIMLDRFRLSDGSAEIDLYEGGF